MTGFCRAYPAEAIQLRVLRGELRSWLGSISAEVNVSQFLLAVGEACANAVEHAYIGREIGMVHVEVKPTGTGDLVVEVRDHGRWRPPSNVWGDRQRGTALMRRLTRDFDRQTTTTGTTVTFLVPGTGRPR